MPTLVGRVAMGNPFVVVRVGNDSFRIVHGFFRAVCRGRDDGPIRSTLAALSLDRTSKRLAGELHDAIERFLVLEKRSAEKFGKLRTFRIWRVGRKTLQVDFGGAYAELKGTSERALKQCITELGANDLLFDDLKKDLREFLKDERPEPLPNATFFRDDGILKVLIDDAEIYAITPESENALRRLSTKAKLDPQRFLATYHEYRSREERIRKALRKSKR